MTATTINTQQDAGLNPAPVSASLPRDGDGGEVEQQKPGNGSTEITSPSDVPELKALMDEIHEVNDKLVKDKWVLGKKLREFRLGLEKHKVKHGNWGDLIETEFGFSYQMASNCMCYSEAADWAQSEAERKFKNFLKLPDTAVCVLWRAGKEAALNEALRRFDNVGRVRLADAKEIAKEFKPAPTENTQPAKPAEVGDTKAGDTKAGDTEADEAQRVDSSEPDGENGLPELGTVEFLIHGYEASSQSVRDGFHFWLSVKHGYHVLHPDRSETMDEESSWHV